MHRPGSARPIAVATWATAMLMGAGQLMAGPYDEPRTYAVLAALVLLAALAWVTMWRPAVEVAPHGVVLRNPLRTVLVTWPAIEAVDGRFGLRVDTAQSHWSAWAAGPPPSGARRQGLPSDVAVAVEERREQVRSRGHMDRGPVEGDGAQVDRDVRALQVLGGAAAVFAVALAVSLLT